MVESSLVIPYFAVEEFLLLLRHQRHPVGLLALPAGRGLGDVRPAPLHSPGQWACLQRVQVTPLAPRLPGQGALSAGGRGRHRPLETRAPVTLGHRGVGGDAAVGLRLRGRRGRRQVVRRVVVQRVEIRKGTLRQQDSRLLKYCGSSFTWLCPLGSGSYRSDREVKGFRELRNAIYRILYCQNSLLTSEAPPDLIPS